MGELADFARQLSTLTDPATLSRITAKAGAAGKKAGQDAAAKDLGGDRAMSRLRGGRAPLNVGYDQRGSLVQLNFRGPWRLAESGRKGTKPIVPKRRGGKRAVLTPMGPRARSTSTPSRGLRTYTDAVNDAQREVPKAANRQVEAEIRRVVS